MLATFQYLKRLSSSIFQPSSLFFQQQGRTLASTASNGMAITPDEPSKLVLIGGSSGLIGSSLVPFLESYGHEVVRLVRRTPRSALEVEWDPEKGLLDPAHLEGIQAVMHLGGVGIADKRWDERRKEEIVLSRTQSTTLLAETMAGMDNPPEVFLSSSAIGFYGNRGEEVVDEASEQGEGYLTEVATAWEASAEAARKAGIRTVYLRTGIVLSSEGGALGQMLLPFSLGLGGPVGSGEQFLSWISMRDHIEAVKFLMVHSECEGAYNLTAPHPVRQKEFASTLGSVLSRPAFLPMPAFMARLAFGELADPLLLEGQCVLPTRLQEAGFTFSQPTLEGALHEVLNK